MRKPLVIMGVAAAVLALSTSALAAPSANTNVTFTVATAELNLTAPDSASLGSAFAGSEVSGQVGTVTVSDQRAALLATWTASVASTSFTTGTGTPAETILPDLVSYWSGPATASSGVGTLVPGQPTAADAVTLHVARTAFSKTSGNGNNSASWNPTLVITVPADAVGGLYSGTVTHSVA